MSEPTRTNGPLKRGSWKIVLIILAAPLVALLGDWAGGNGGYALALFLIAVLAFVVA